MKIEKTVNLPKILRLLAWAMSAGSLWRCSRGMSLYPGGNYILACILSLFLWGIPLRKLEENLGFREEPQGSANFEEALRQASWWRVWVSLALAAYLSVLVGWTLRFSLYVFGGLLYQNTSPSWDLSITSPWEGAVFQLLTMALAIAKAFHGGIFIENFINKLMPWFLCLSFLGGAVSIPYNLENMKGLLSLDVKHILSPIIWIDALIQSVWITGAGWFFFKEDQGEGGSSGLNWGIVGVLVLLGCALTVKSVEKSDPGHPGHFFLGVYSFFSDIPGGEWLAFSIFLVTAILGIRALGQIYSGILHHLVEFGLKQNRAIIIVALSGFILGILSASNVEFLLNQDLVWGGALLISGALVAREGKRLKESNDESVLEDAREKRSFEELWCDYAPKLLGALFCWWLFRELLKNPLWWNPLATDSPMTAIVQWCFPASLIYLGSKAMDDSKDAARPDTKKRAFSEEGELIDSKMELS